jgi:quaternary ammonium compound-resistance protein SugE
LDYRRPIRKVRPTTAEERRNLAWVYLVLAGLLEIAWPLGVKWSDGFTRPLPVLGAVLSIAASFALFGLASRSVPVGTAYAVWTGMGAAGAAILGMVLWQEPAGAARIACLVAIVAGVVGLKLFAP